MRDHKDFDIEWIGFPENKSGRRLKGCYLIGDVYVGASTHIRERVLYHCRSIYSTKKEEYTQKTRNYESMTPKEKYIYWCILNGYRIRVKYISDDVLQEKEMYIKYNIPFKTNTSFFTKGFEDKIKERRTKK